MQYLSMIAPPIEVHILVSELITLLLEDNYGFMNRSLWSFKKARI